MPGILTRSVCRSSAGRSFNADEVASHALLAVLSRTTLRRLWPRMTPADALNRHLRTGDGDRLIVGITGDLRPTPDADPAAAVFVPITAPEATSAQSGITALIRFDSAVPPDVRLFETALNRHYPQNTAQLVSFESTFGDVSCTPRMLAVLMGAFACLGLALVALGLYAVARFELNVRDRELRIKAALGAGAGRLRRSILGTVLPSIAAGATVGLLAILVASRLAAASAAWPTTLEAQWTPWQVTSCAVATLLVVSCVAILGPLRQAGRVEASGLLTRADSKK